MPERHAEEKVSGVAGDGHGGIFGQLCPSEQGHTPCLLPPQNVP